MKPSLPAAACVAALFLVSSLTGFAQDKTPAASTQQPTQFRETVTRELALDFLLQLPDGYDAAENADKKWPLLVFLHGAGERGSNLDLLKKHGPPKLIEAGKKFPAIVISPQCPENSWWPDEPVLELIDHAERTYRVDTSRIYLTGLSMGGYGTWHFASRTPDRFAAIVPICGGGVPYHMRKLTKLPIWVFHGQKDTAVPFEESERLVKALEKAGNQQVKFTIYPEAGHDSWTAAYDTPELWDWLFAQQRKP
ncbi:MAG: prolyl oligopeptidase family serine peptidase [Verrucomicrobiae bacterium]|nr:prolyl oligopeptidase family serine peptidase [Verrucomicrobiae bacterium]